MAFPIMLLVRELEIPSTITASLKCEYSYFPFCSFFYGEEPSTEHFVNKDFEFELLKKVQNNSFSFEIEERNALYFYAVIKRLTILKRAKDVSVCSLFYLANMHYRQELINMWQDLYLHPLFIIKNNGVIQEDFILTELAESINKNKFEIQNRHMSSGISYVDKIDFRLKRFVDLYHDLLDERIFKQSTILQEYVDKKNDAQSVCYDKNIDTFVEQFPYLHKDIILVLLCHVVHNKFLSAVNGHIVAKPRFIHDSKMLINQESKNFIKELKELHSSMLGNSHILVRCDDKDVCKLFKKASYVKM
jgi:hypothetical protein